MTMYRSISLPFHGNFNKVQTNEQLQKHFNSSFIHFKAVSNFVTGIWQGNDSSFQPAAKILLLCEIPIGMICQEVGLKFSLLWWKNYSFKIFSYRKDEALIFFETRSHAVLAGLKLVLQLRLTLKFWSSLTLLLKCSMHHHAWLEN